MKNNPATNSRLRPIDRRGLPYPKMFRRRLGPGFCVALFIGRAACNSEPSVDSASSTTIGNVAAAAPTQRIAVTAKAGRFEPAEVRLVQGVPAVLEFTRVVDSACMNAVRMPWMKEAVDLPMNEKVEISVDTLRTGTFSYSCWMDMVFGKVVIDKAESVNPPSLLDGLSAGDPIPFTIDAPQKAIVKIEKLAPKEGAAESAQEAARQALGEPAAWWRAPQGEPRGGRAWSNHIPNVVLTTHLGKKVKFYDDLIKDKIVVINFMYATCTET